MIAIYVSKVLFNLTSFSIFDGVDNTKVVLCCFFVKYCRMLPIRINNMVNFRNFGHTSFTVLELSQSAIRFNLETFHEYDFQSSDVKTTSESVFSKTLKTF